MKQRLSILFICHGNICRSPMAEFIFKDMLRRQNLEGRFLVESAGTSSEEEGNPVYPPARRILERHGLDCAGKRARRIEPEDYDKFDFLLCAESYNIRNLKRFFPNDIQHKIHRLLDFTDSPRDISDPWYSGNFQLVFDEITEGCRALLHYLLKEYPQLAQGQAETRKKRPGAIIDLDGFLLDSLKAWHRLDRDFLEKHGLYNEENMHAMTNASTIAFAADYMVAHHFPGTRQDVINEITSMIEDAYHNTAALFPGALDFLQTLKDNGYSLVLLTAAPEKMAMAALQRTGAAPFFDAFVCNADKHAEQPFLDALAAIGTSIDCTTVYDDQPWVRETAARLGFKTSQTFTM